MPFGCFHLNQKTNENISVFLPYLFKIGQKERIQIIILRLGAQNFTLLNTLREPTQLRRRQLATRQHLFFGCPLLSSLEQLFSAPNHE